MTNRSHRQQAEVRKLRSPRLTRRSLLAAGGLGLAGISLAREGWAQPPKVRNPRATDGDDRHEPNWKQRLTIKVGNKKGDLVGGDDKVLQAAIDYVALVDPDSLLDVA